MFIDFREREGKRGREGNIDVRERKGVGERERVQKKRNINMRKKHQSVASHTCPDQGSNLQPGCVP